MNEQYEIGFFFGYHGVEGSPDIPGMDSVKVLYTYGT